ncbi:MAG: H-type small acid-soluble spore protein [Bacillota bacterium]|uniref:Small, acid-soluble spore protein H n=1 Tax=Virgibacillus salarius TaxID=447199 RepID=A0A941DTP5_9BACI|nr:MULTISPECIES: H-type small acid-soluble spore protein [Virgibacillus]NAZ07674.1 H-type small acid-soluble spore protein [Agaribacter marinus]MBR7794954.1 H-type small acid-soluble spore protein [Virgibacillus salarius]MCC2252510.1 H-type small acid-soluble spore protein [Virgibacillus sp. AGTR]MDY7045065.1 H-type small acid-soluble spore protein [Virgibacillus sp. M23]QRZ18761.1 H-type small acid-soluble spore protein [Virgibacillus sp. AGTR]
MDKERAQEIMNAAEMIQVRYRGIPVYIKSLHEKNTTATIFPLDEMENEQIVDIQGLHELQLDN